MPQRGSKTRFLGGQAELSGVGGHHAYDYGGHPAPTGPALPNLINAVSILKSKSTSLSRRQPKSTRF